MVTMTCEEKKELFAEILKIKGQIKELAAAQKADKTLLRGPHAILPLQEYTLSNGYKVSRRGRDRASYLMGECYARARDISRLHIVYNKLRGKPWEMHERRR